MALALAPAGVRLALVARDLERLSAVAAEARQLGAEAEVFQADIGDEAQVLELERQVSRIFGRVDILINNAGINIRKLCVDYTLAEWNSILTTNLTSVFLMCRAFVPHMQGRGYGRVINITSIMAHISLPQRTAYSASKAGLLGFTRSLALEMAREGVTVVAISPGPFATEMTEAIINDPAKSEQFMSHTPMRRWGDPEDVGKLALFLCSADASFITGTDIVIDGGWCAE
jgi:NAD(P)-dependent dehydrogenase (short-subunit alcohol dehydrogenase family)